MGSPTAQCLKRLQIELHKLATEKDVAYQIGADPQNMLRVYFVMDGPADTPYAGGRYVGLLEIPPDYPFKPPSVQMCTPSGRFKTGMAICLSNSSYHPEQWSPMWGLRTILIALVSFFVSNESTTGSVDSSEAERRKYAANSRQYNVDRIKTVYKRVLPEAYAKDVAYLEKQESGMVDRPSQQEDGEIESGDTDVGDRGDKAPSQQNQGGKTETTDTGKGEEPTSVEKPSDAEAPKKSHQRSLHAHRRASTDEAADKVMQLGGVPWRRWLSMAVLVAVGLVLMEQLRWCLGRR